MIWIWTGFIAFVLLMLALDLGVFHRKAQVVSVKNALRPAFAIIYRWVCRCRLEAGIVWT